MRWEIWLLLLIGAAIVTLFFGARGPALHSTQPEIPLSQGDWQALAETRTQDLIRAFSAHGLPPNLLQDFPQALKAGRWQEEMAVLSRVPFLLAAWVRLGRLSPLDEALLQLKLAAVLNALVLLAQAQNGEEIHICMGLYETAEEKGRIIGPFLQEAMPWFRLKPDGTQEWVWQLKEQACM